MLQEKIKRDLAGAIRKATGIKVEEIDLQHPQNPAHGDYSSNFAIANFEKIPSSKFQISNSLELARKIVENVPKRDYLEKAEAVAPGFINFWLSEKFLIKELERAIKQGDQYGSGDWGKGKKWLIEHTSPNPNKAMHLGHLRNNVTGMAIANIWEFLGVETIRDAVDNNRGIAIARLMWGYLKFAHCQSKEITDINYWYEHQDEWQSPEGLGIRPDRFVDELYTKASQDFRSNPETEEKVRKLVVDWENQNQKVWALWQKVLDYSYQGQELTLKRLGNRWDKVWHEHEHYQMGKDLVQDGLEKGIFKKLKDNAIISNLEKYGIPDTVLIKSDGSALYITQDIALTKLKRDRFKPDKLFWVIGPEQSLALKQLFAICEQLGIGKLKDYTHIAYGWMSIKDQGRMSSRLGNVVYIDELIDAAQEEISNKIDKNRFKENELDETVEKIALGAVKYSVLKKGRMINTAFDFGESLSFEGNSGPYLQYTYARARSILRKAQMNRKSEIGNRKSESAERAMLRLLYQFPEVVEAAAKNYSPNLICNYLFELAQAFNAFYESTPVLKAESKDLRKTRLALTAATAQILKNGLYLLGIEAPEQM